MKKKADSNFLQRFYEKARQRRFTKTPAIKKYYERLFARLSEASKLSKL
jgi:hypothetical protein